MGYQVSKNYGLSILSVKHSLIFLYIPIPITDYR